MKTATMILMAVTAVLWAKDRDWKMGHIREGGRFQQQAAAPATSRSTHPVSILLDHKLRNKVKSVWGYGIEGPKGLVYLVESKSALDIDIDEPVQFATEGGNLFLLDKRGKERKVPIFRQTTMQQLEAESR